MNDYVVIRTAENFRRLRLLIIEAPVLANKVEIERERSEREHQQFLLACEERRRQNEEKRRLKVIQDSRDRLSL
jgi:hypothetical protein